MNSRDSVILPSLHKLIKSTLGGGLSGFKVGGRISSGALGLRLILGLERLLSRREILGLVLFGSAAKVHRSLKERGFVGM